MTHTMITKSFLCFVCTLEIPKLCINPLIHLELGFLEVGHNRAKLARGFQSRFFHTCSPLALKGKFSPGGE